VRAGEAIAELRRCRQLPKELRLESDCDHRVERIARGLMLAGADEVGRFRHEASADELALLLTWVDRASSLAVRQRDADLLVVAVFGFGFAGSAQGGDNWLHLQSQLRQAARIIGRDADEAWSAAIAASDAEGAAWLGENRGRRRFLRSRFPVGQFSDPYDGGRFRFGRQRPPSDRVPLRDQPPGEPSRPDLYGVPVLRGIPEVRTQLEQLVADLWQADRRADADRVLHAVLMHDAAPDALNELHAVLIHMHGTGAADALLERLAAR
jgi:hypothetical protein